MHSLRKWFYRPKKEDSSKLALFYWADEELTMVATELDSFDGRTDPDRCSILVTQLRICQDKVLGIINDITDEALPDIRRANRDFRAKFPDDVMHDNLAGQLWFGAECLAAGSNIIHRELESASMRPLAKALTRALESVRCYLREQSLKNSLVYSEKVQDALRLFDRLFAEFELCYVSAMVPIKSAKEYHLQQDIIVLFSETLIRALKIGLVTQDMIDDYDPSLMFTIPRLAIIWGLLMHPYGPFSVERDSNDLSELFRPFCNLLFKIRDLLWTLRESELRTLEKMLCSQEEPKIEEKSETVDTEFTKPPEDSVSQFCRNQLKCKQFIHDFYAYNFGINVSENCVPSGSEDRDNENISSKKSLKRKNSNVSFVDYQTPEAHESDIETCVSSDFGLNEVFCIPRTTQRLSFPGELESVAPCYPSERNKNTESHICGDNLRLTSSAGSSPNHMHLNSSHLAPTDDNCACHEYNVEHTAYSLENHLSNLHKDCLCGVEHLTPSREIMRQVMRRVEIVPPGQRIAGYSSSVENSSPRAYHHGLVSHSFPSHPGHGSQCSRTSARCLLKRTPSRRRNSSVCDSQASSPRQGGNVEAWSSNPVYSSPLTIPRVQHLRQEDNASISEATYSSCSSCQSISSVSSAEWVSTSPDTSSYNSECQDDEEIALALQAAEIASRNKARSRFKSSWDLLHKLFVCVSGVADQLQTNYASDLRNILKSVFDMNCQNLPDPCDNSKKELNQDSLLENSVFTESNSNDPLLHEDENSLNNNSREEGDRSSLDSAEEVVADSSPTPSLVTQTNENDIGILTGPPEWMPDEFSTSCMACKVQFTILRRRHHCRNCGKIFCSRCSSNSIPLPRFGHLKPVRVCNQCFMYQLTNLVMQRQLF